MTPSAAFGALTWLLLASADGLGAVDLGLVTLLLALAPLVVVPLGLALTGGSTRAGRLATGFQPVGAAAAVVSLLLPQGRGAAAVAGTWLAICALVTADGVACWWGARSLSPICLARLGACGSLSVGGGWFVVDRLGGRPLNLPATIVELTAVHFHYAGFAAVLVAGALTAAVAGARRRAAGAATLAVLAGSPVVAAGFALHGALQVAGAVLLAVGLVAVAWLTVRHVVTERLHGAPRALLVTSSAAVVVPMFLAVQWAVGHNLGTPALSIPEMARVHGTLNAFGFTLCGLLGWLSTTSSDRPGRSF